MVEVTVFTPTYNRAYILKQLYESLMKQTDMNFEWVIVDDGSIDNTEEIVNLMQKKAAFVIKYIYKENEGKHIAINEGVKHANGKWFFIVDSDDYLTENAIETIRRYCSTINNDLKCAGVVGLKANSNKEILLDYGKTYDKESKLFRDDYIDASCIEYRFKYNIRGDRAEVVRTKLLKKYPFPKFEGEKFLTEGYLWLSLARDGFYFRWFNQIIYIAEYLEDGLTTKMRTLVKENPKATFFMADFCLGIRGLPIKEYIRNSYRYYMYGKVTGKRTILLWKKDKKKIFALIGLILAKVKK